MNALLSPATVAHTVDVDLTEDGFERSSLQAAVREHER
jgi:hypothetical protein